MAIQQLITNSATEESSTIAYSESDVKKTSKYSYIDTNNEGIKKVVSHQGGWLVFCDYGYEMRPNKHTGVMEKKRRQSIRHTKTEAEAKKLKREADDIREKEDPEGYKNRKIKFKDMLEEYKESPRFSSLDEDYQIHKLNHFNHILDFFADYEPKKITVINIEQYYKFQLEHGNRKVSTNGTVIDKGISINTISKHRTTLKDIFDYMIAAKKYGVTENVVERSLLPKVPIEVDGKIKRVAKIQFHARSYTLEELNYTLNDAIQHEFDRSIVLFIALAGIGALRRSEIVALPIKNFYHNELMDISEQAMNIGGFDIDYYKEHDNLMLIDSAYMRVKGKEVLKLPKADHIRVAAIPNVLREIVDYYMEQRLQFYEVIGKNLDKNERIYFPLVNLIKQKEPNTSKLNKKWLEYEARRNQRMLKSGLTPIPEIRIHDLRHTAANLAKMRVPSWEISYNMGHVLGGNTTQRVYWNDRQPFRDDIIEFFDSNIKIDWSKANKMKINEPGAKAYLNSNGHLIVTSEEREQRKKENKKFIFSEDELVEMLGKENEEREGKGE